MCYPSIFFLLLLLYTIDGYLSRIHSNCSGMNDEREQKIDKSSQRHTSLPFRTWYNMPYSMYVIHIQSWYAQLNMNIILQSITGRCERARAAQNQPAIGLVPSLNGHNKTLYNNRWLIFLQDVTRRYRFPMRHDREWLINASLFNSRH